MTRSLLTALAGLLFATFIAGSPAIVHAADESADPGGATPSGSAQASDSDSSSAKKGRAATSPKSRPHHLESLDLTAEQRKALDALPGERTAWQAAHRSEVAKLRAGVAEARREGDAEKSKALTAELQALLATKPSAQSILTDKQRAELKKKRPAAGTKSKGRPAMMQSLHKKLRDAERAGDTARVAELQSQIAELKQAVRANRAKAAAADTGGGASH